MICKMQDEIIVKTIEANDKNKVKHYIKNIVNIHLASFKGFFLSSLGSRFLYLLYLNIARDKNGIILTAEINGEQVGFVAGVLDQEGFYKRLIRGQLCKFAIASIPGLLRKPGIILRLIRALKRPEEASAYSSRACLMSIGVDPRYQGKRVGEILIEAFCNQLIRNRCKTFCLTTDKYDNDRVNKFYQKMGFELVRTFITPEGRVMNEYLKIIEKGNPR